LSPSSVSSTCFIHDALPILLDGVYTSGTAHVVSGASLLLKGPSGQPDVQRYIDFVYQPLVEADGTSGIFVVGSDTTQNKLATERSEEHTSELQSRENLVCRL